VSGFGRHSDLDFERLFAIKNAIGEGKRERRALSGEAFRGSVAHPAWFRASAPSQGEGFREFQPRFRSERAVAAAEVVKGEQIRELK
jgi:hypothetical protein